MNDVPRYQIAYTFGRKGTCVMRVEIPGDGLVQTRASAPFAVTVTN